LGERLEPEVAFGQVLRELRKRQKLSQETLALESGMERNYVSLLELGRNSASVKMIFKIAPVLGVTVADFMEMVEARTKEKSKPKSATKG
jgi:transcriptional regulator with XRE-family HTH domain